MRKKSLIKSVICLAAAGVMLLGGAALAADKISISGSTTVLPIAQKAAEVYMKTNPGAAEISVSGTGSGDGLKALVEGSIDIADSSRAAKDKEIKLADEKGVKLVKHVVALDCIVPVVNPANKVTGLTKAQIKDIYTGAIKNWSEVGGDDGPIVVISRDSSSGTFEVWNELVLHKERVRPDAQLQASNGAVAQAVASNKYAIGYVGIGYLSKDLKGLTVDGVAASSDAARDKSYPVSRELYMYTNGEPTGAVKAFIDFVMGAEGQKIAGEEGFVPVR
ncbi:PstS family phosphate ABC transporter substrate-binding protein [Desulfarculus baarsii]